MKLLKKIIRRNLYELDFGSDFLDMTPSTGNKRKNRLTELHQN